MSEAELECGSLLVLAVLVLEAVRVSGAYVESSNALLLAVLVLEAVHVSGTEGQSSNPLLLAVLVLEAVRVSGAWTVCMSVAADDGGVVKVTFSASALLIVLCTNIGSLCMHSLQSLYLCSVLLSSLTLFQFLKCCT